MSLLVFAAGAALSLFPGEVIAWLQARLPAAGLSPFVRPLLFTVPVALLFFLRGKGEEIPAFGNNGARGLSDGTGLLVAAVIALLPAALLYFMPRCDEAMRGFYDSRDRLLPAKWRPAAAVAVTLLVAFALHGNLIDFKVMLLLDSDKAAVPEFGKVLAATSLTATLGMLLMRDPAPREATS